MCRICFLYCNKYREAEVEGRIIVFDPAYVGWRRRWRRTTTNTWVIPKITYIRKSYLPRLIDTMLFFLVLYRSILGPLPFQIHSSISIQRRSRIQQSTYFLYYSIVSYQGLLLGIFPIRCSPEWIIRVFKYLYTIKCIE